MKNNLIKFQHEKKLFFFSQKIENFQIFSARNEKRKMEYRVFREIDGSTFGGKENSESRTDIYIILESLPSFGLKLRHKKQLELKRRMFRYENGTELWTKEKVSSDSVNVRKKEELCRILSEKNLPELVEALRKSDELIFCSVKKFQEKTYFGDKIYLERCLFRYEFLDGRTNFSLGAPEFGETICFESDSSRPIDLKTIRENLSLDEFSQPMGYPEFLNEKLAKLVQSKRF